MTTWCSGNPAAPNTEFGTFVYMGPAALGALLNNVPVKWAVPLAAFLGGVTYELANFCTGEPPELPTISDEDVANILGVFDPVLHSLALQKVRDLVGHYLWPQLCHCTVVATPPPDSPPAAPTGMPNINPSLPGGPQTGLPCASFDAGEHSVSTSTVTPVFGPFNPPPGVTGLNIIVDHVSGGSSGLTSYELMASATSSFSGAAAVNPAFPGGASPYHNESGLKVYSNIRPFFWFEMHVASGTVIGRPRVDFYCDFAFPNGPIGNCGCPPDPIMGAQLQELLTLTRLIQRQAAPFGYVAGAVHSGLSDNGSLTIADLIGVKVEVTTLPDSYGRASGDPIEYFELGFLTWGTTDGYRTSERVEHEFQVLFPPLAGVFTSLGYTLAPGVVVTVTELVREP